MFRNRFHALGAHFYSEFQPQGLENPTLVCSSAEVLQQLGLHADEVNTDLFLQVFSGNALLSGMQPLAQDYAGHQFGHFNPFLGDGRAVLLGEVETPDGIVDLYLKGVGKTPYARTADGRAGLRECLHEFDTTEQLAALGVPTARCLCVTSGSQQVYRQGFEPIAMVTRIAPSHVRFGTFENYFFQKNPAALRLLADHVIACHFPACAAEGEARYAAFFREVVLRTARLIAHWQAVGFVHGVMNTDNQSIMPRQLLCPVGDNYLVRLVVVESGLVLPPVHGRLSAVTLPLAFQNGGMVDEPINGGDGHHVVLKYLPPFAEGMVGGDDE